MCSHHGSGTEAATVGRATDVLKEEHRVIEGVLDCLEELARRATAAGRLDGAAAAEALDFFRHFADGCHHAKEERALFPALEAHGFSPLGPTAVMRHEHEAGREYLRGLATHLDAAAAGDGAAVVCFARYAGCYAHMLRQHILKEDHCLFAMADRALGEDDQAGLLRDFERLEHDGPGDGEHQRYLEVARRLARQYGPAGVCGGEGECYCHRSLT